MAKTMRLAALICTAAGVLAALICQFFTAPFFLALTITLLTTAYHLDMRLFVGTVVDGIMQNRANYRAWWFRPRPFEAGLYRFLRVRRWKDKLPTYDPAAFSQKGRTLEQVIQATCQAEIVHEIIVILSFAPLFAVRAFGSLPVFLLTSLAAAGYDLLFVVLQRWNRPRLLRVMAKRRNQASAVRNQASASRM